MFLIFFAFKFLYNPFNRLLGCLVIFNLWQIFVREGIYLKWCHSVQIQKNYSSCKSLVQRNMQDSWILICFQYAGNQNQNKHFHDHSYKQAIMIYISLIKCQCNLSLLLKYIKITEIIQMYPSHITPKRRHSSLFERMQNEIKKISKKLSAAKTSYRQSSARNPSAAHKNQRSFPVSDPLKKQEQFLNSYNSIDDQTVIATARHNRQNNPRYVYNNQRKNKNVRAASTLVNQDLNLSPPRGADQDHSLKNANINKPIKQNAGKVIKGLSTMPLKKRIHESNYHTMRPESFQFDSEEKTDINMKIILKLQQENSNLSFQLGKVSNMCQTQSYKVGRLKAQLRETSKQFFKMKQKQEKENCYLVTLLDHYKEKANKYKRALRKNSQVSIDLESSQFH